MHAKSEETEFPQTEVSCPVTSRGIRDSAVRIEHRFGLMFSRDQTRNSNRQRQYTLAISRILRRVEYHVLIFIVSSVGEKKQVEEKSERRIVGTNSDVPMMIGDSSGEKRGKSNSIPIPPYLFLFLFLCGPMCLSLFLLQFLFRVWTCRLAKLSCA